MTPRSAASHSDLNDSHDETATPLFSFGVIADIQYAPIPDGASFSGNPRYYRHALAVAHTAFAHFQESHMDLVVQLGDILDGKCQEIEAHGGTLPTTETDTSNDDTLQEEVNNTNNNIHAGLACLRHVQDAMKPYQQGPIIHTYGNHCLYNLPRAVLRDKLGIPFVTEQQQETTPPNNNNHDADLVGYDASQCLQGIRFVVLDSYDIALLGRDGSTKHHQATQILTQHNPNFPANMNSPQGLEGIQRRFVGFNGAVGDTQLQWLRQTLQQARHNHERVVLLSHQPLAPESSHGVCLIWNYQEVLDILHEFDDVVIASLSGHAHKGGYHYDTDHDIHYCVIAAALESPPPTTSYAMVHVYPDRLSMQGFGDCESRELPFLASKTMLPVNKETKEDAFRAQEGQEQECDEVQK